MNKILVSDIEKYLDGTYDWENNPDNIEYDFEYKYKRPSMNKIMKDVYCKFIKGYIEICGYNSNLESYEIYYDINHSELLLEYNIFDRMSYNNLYLSCSKIGAYKNRILDILDEEFNIIYRIKLPLTNFIKYDGYLFEGNKCSCYEINKNSINNRINYILIDNISEGYNNKPVYIGVYRKNE